jgi:His-Xaa-Ser system radical SAM maturase HxsB
MITFPLRFRELDSNRLLFSNEAGRSFIGSRSFLDRYVHDSLCESDKAFLSENGLAIDDADKLGALGYLTTLAARLPVQKQIDYLILVPTLRCNLSCSYCQVSRASENAKGFDWSDDTTHKAISFLKNLPISSHIKIEFQGGEPLLRTDILDKVMREVSKERPDSSFVICSNLSNLGPEQIKLFQEYNVVLSTSLDGPAETHKHNRTKNEGATRRFLDNLDRFRDLFDGERISALPTIDLTDPPSTESLLDSYDALGITSIYLRPVNHQGFARKRGLGLDDALSSWLDYYRKAVDEIIHRNSQRSKNLLEEYSLTLAIKRILRPGIDNNVDLRNPAPLGLDYLVIDYDGKIYPTDEARMLGRIGRIDLSLGRIGGELNYERIRDLNSQSFNNIDPDCQHCVYQPYCGSDVVDDLSRYGRIDIPRHDTYFCRRQTDLFDLATSLLCSKDLHVLHSLCAWLNLPELPDQIIPVHNDTA